MVARPIAGRSSAAHSLSETPEKTTSTHITPSRSPEHPNPCPRSPEHNQQPNPDHAPASYKKIALFFRGFRAVSFNAPFVAMVSLAAFVFQNRVHLKRAYPLIRFPYPFAS